ncbi:glycosyltransferase family 1 protein [Ideonella sp.]|uniref:glycosyltransferase family 1 protein n=1 Tax=Ideonella sp. TaxID=1929293 RepID=UPI002B488195|nr:glycosyltransferase family 1 protein [Ideonella sp.]HJV70926.1 glycosyltransferase family 1 protein [Ideonella sp.]
MIWRRLFGSRARVVPPPGTPADAAGARRLLLLEEGGTPSGDYILAPWLATLGPPVRRLDARQPPHTGQIEPGDFVVVQRYLHAPWRQAIERQRHELAGLAWFLDDDLLDPAALAELAGSYAHKIHRLALSQRPWFEQMGSQWWVATEPLARKYGAQAPTVLPFAPPAALVRPRPAVRVVYHGTASHQREIDWLHPVVAEVQRRCEHTHVELFGELPVNRRFRDLPRVAVLHPMRWDSYLAHTAAHPADIGLAPLLPGVFNAARGPVKFADYTRQGALGLYSRVPPYEGFVRDGVDGALLPNEPEAWVDAIVRWAGDPAGRAACVAAARARFG